MPPRTVHARDAVHRLFFRRSWSTRQRNVDVARCLKAVLSPGELLLDVGCGPDGLSDFIGSAAVVGMDIQQPSVHASAKWFVRASITALPFADSSIPVVAAVDVLEHVTAAEREHAVAELMRVARTAAVVGFPCGPQAERADQDFQTSLRKRRKMAPSWLVEHLRSSYPSVDSIVAAMTAAAATHRRRIKTMVRYSEDIRVTRLLRWAASRSELLFVGIDLLAGLSASLIRQPDKTSSYRAIVVARFR